MPSPTYSYDLFRKHILVYKMQVERFLSPSLILQRHFRSEYTILDTQTKKQTKHNKLFDLGSSAGVELMRSFLVLAYTHQLKRQLNDEVFAGVLEYFARHFQKTAWTYFPELTEHLTSEHVTVTVCLYRGEAGRTVVVVPFLRLYTFSSYSGEKAHFFPTKMIINSRNKIRAVR